MTTTGTSDTLLQQPEWRTLSRMEFDQALIDPCSAPDIQISEVWRQEARNCRPLDLSRSGKPAAAFGQLFENDDDGSSFEDETFYSAREQRLASSSSEGVAEGVRLKTTGHRRRPDSSEMCIALPDDRDSRTPSPTRHELSDNWKGEDLELVALSENQILIDWIVKRQKLSMVDIIRLMADSPHGIS
ncbi:hypothetical protein BV898_11718 [Hypsibius exemplaris]|uniref:Uncharacterized protein n=1 Tax=Hypsibius exemplaris TaxID=2072580 RepID=A0A1W0WG06_HYPEX|nr:hypothetical protein BV898_11718 [Hypsibius exemplaris]